MSMKKPVPVNIITGMLGAGKTTTIQFLLRHRPAGERWAVLVNEFGNIGIDGALLEGEGVVVREVPGGCICCTAAMTLKTTLTDMLRRIPMDRLLIEPTGLGHPAGVVDALRDDWLRDAISLKNIITIIEPEGFSDERLEKSLVYSNQLQLADVVLINKAETADEARLEQIEHWLEGLYPPKQAVLRGSQGALPLAWLEGEGHTEDSADKEHGHHHHHDASCSLERKGPFDSSFSSREEGGMLTLGWRFPAEVIFDRRRVEASVSSWMENLPQLKRIKAVLNCGRTTYGVNATSDTVTISPVAWRQDSRIEVIATLEGGLDETLIEQGFAAWVKVSKRS
jgi:G3E family GTPase